jgi:hypothetical protein
MTFRRARIGFAFPAAGLVLLMAGTSAAAPSANPEALLSRVQHAYLHVAGIELTATKGGQNRRFLLRLTEGKVTEEEFLGPGSDGLVLVARHGGSTFMRASRAKCWRPLGKWNPRTLLNVDGPFPDHGKVLVRYERGARRLLIETHAAFWFLAGSVVPSHIARKSFLTVAPNPSTNRIGSIGVTAPEPSAHATLAVRPLDTPPSIPSPTPVCSY